MSNKLYEVHMKIELILALHVFILYNKCIKGDELMNITEKEVIKLCNLYSWLNVFLSQINHEQLQKLEDDYFKNKNRKPGLPRIQLELDIYHSLEHCYNSHLLSERQQTLKKQITKRKNKDIEQIKSDVCQFLLELDSIDKNISMTSHLYSAYPSVYNRIYKDLLYLFENTTDKEIMDIIGKTLFKKKYILYKFKHLRKLLLSKQTNKSQEKKLTLKK